MTDKNAAGAPSWLTTLEGKLESIKQRNQLGHEFGAGSICLKCDLCPGLELHFWRKQCKNCKCGREDHDIPQDQNLLRMEILLPSPNGNAGVLELKSNDQTKPTNQINKIKYDWLPPETPNEMAIAYMKELPSAKAPITGSPGAKYRQAQLDLQIPLYDISPDVYHKLSDQEKKGFESHLKAVKDDVGMGKIKKLRVYFADSNQIPSIDNVVNNNINRGVQDLRLSPRPFLPKPPSNPRSANICRALRAQVPTTPKMVRSSPALSSDRISSEEVTTDNILTVHKDQTCVECKEPLVTGSVAIVADKVAEDKAWHPKCFICSVCKELLVDLVYFFHKGLLYCERDYAEKKNIKRCHDCDELIFASAFTLADVKYYHLNHFCCVMCDVELAGKSYLLDKKQPTCLDCFDNTYGSKCGTCRLLIRAGESGIRYKHLDWHNTPACFKCYTCAKKLAGIKFIVSDEKPFCSQECASLFLR